MTYPAGELNLCLSALCGSVFYVLEALCNRVFQDKGAVNIHGNYRYRSGNLQLCSGGDARRPENRSDFRHRLQWHSQRCGKGYGERKVAVDPDYRIDTALHETKEALLRKDVSFAGERAEALKKVIQETGGVLYSQSVQAADASEAAQAGAEAPTGKASPGSKVVDAEYRENA
jgi:hypothetical protein